MTTEMRRLTSSGWPTGSKPSTLIWPASGLRSVVNIFSVVVFPAPFGPSSPKIAPRRTEKVRPSTARTGGCPRRLNVLTRSRTMMASSDIAEKLDDRFNHAFAFGERGVVVIGAADDPEGLRVVSRLVELEAQR